MESKDLRHKNTWSATYKKIPFEIQNYKTKGMAEYHIKEKDNWNYYVYFRKFDMPIELFNLLTAGIKEGKYSSCNYYDSPVANLDWHGGITFGQLTRDENSELICLKAGCDYQHYWDEDFDYCLDYVLGDALKTIDGFFETYSTFFKDLESPQDVTSKPLPL
jgi:hypothetical protein